MHLAYSSQNACRGNRFPTLPGGGVKPTIRHKKNSPPSQFAMYLLLPTFSRKHPASTCQWSGRLWIKSREKHERGKELPVAMLSRYVSGPLWQPAIASVTVHWTVYKWEADEFSSYIKLTSTRAVVGVIQEGSSLASTLLSSPARFWRSPFHRTWYACGLSK